MKNFVKIMSSLFARVKNTVGKGQHFLLFPQCFPNPSFLGLLKVNFKTSIVNMTCEICSIHSAMKAFLNIQ